LSRAGSAFAAASRLAAADAKSAVFSLRCIDRAVA
jgi:hypothetical protein